MFSKIVNVVNVVVFVVVIVYYESIVFLIFLYVVYKAASTQFVHYFPSINHKVAPARVALGLTPMLTIVTLTGGARGSLPR